MMTNKTDLLCSILHFATVLLCLHFISLTLWTFCAWNVFCCGAWALDRLIIIIIMYWKISTVEVRLHFNLVQKCCSAMAKLCCMSTELKSLAYRGSCAKVQKLKKLPKLRILR